MFDFFFGGGKKSPKSFIRQNLESLLLALLLALFVRAFIIQPFKIPSSSMEPTLLVGDYIIVEKFAYGIKIPFSNLKIFKGETIKEGDVAVFKKPLSYGKKKKTYFIKRVIATGNDVVQIRGRSVFVNGSEIRQSYAGLDANKGFDRYVQNFGDKNVNVIYERGLYSTYKGHASRFVVPEGHVFFMGDNRDNSLDSRSWGTIPEKDIVGKAVLVHWSWNFQNSLIPQIRWKRIFLRVE